MKTTAMRRERSRYFAAWVALLFCVAAIPALCSPTPAFSVQGSAGPAVGLKALLITRTNDYFAPPYNQQAAEQIMRDWGIPFDVVTTNSVNSSTIWDSANQVPKYQFVVYFGGTSLEDQGNDPPQTVTAIQAAIKAGVNFLFVGPAVSSYVSYFGIKSVADCPMNPNQGGVCPTTSFRMLVDRTFTGILRGDPTFSKGTVLTASGFPNVALLLATPGTSKKVSAYLSYSINASLYPSVMYTKNGTSSLWWWSGVEGSYQFTRNGWQEPFNNGLYGLSSNKYAFYSPMVSLFYYALNNATKYDVSILPWSYGGSAEIIRVADHESMCQYSDCASANASEIKGMTSRGLVGEVNVNLNGWSHSAEVVVKKGAPPGAVAFPCNNRYSYYGRLNIGDQNYFGLCAKLDNQSSTQAAGSVQLLGGTSASQTVNFADGNTSEIADLRLLLSSSPGTAWTASITDMSGRTVYTSPVQRAPSQPTWVDLKPNATGSLAGYISSLQGVDTIRVSALNGSLSWSQGPSKFDFVALGRSAWDIVYIATGAWTGTDLNFTGSIPLVPDSVRMANGALYPTDNMTVSTGNPGRVHPADIVGRTNTGAPGGVNFEVFFTTADWSTYGRQAVANFVSLFNSGWVIETNGWTHAKSQYLNADNDFLYGNGTTMGSAAISTRVSSIVTRLNGVLGTSWDPFWTFGTSAQSYYPALSQIESAGFVYAQLSTQQHSILGQDNGGFYQVAPGGLFDAGQGDKATVSTPILYPEYNQTRQELGVIETHSDANYPWNDYDAATAAGWGQKYDLSSTWFCGTTARCMNFWKATFAMLTNVKTFTFSPSTGAVTIAFDSSAPSVIGRGTAIDASKYKDPLIWRLPATLGGLKLESASDSAGAGAIVNATSAWRYYQFNTGGRTVLTVNYGTATPTVLQPIKVYAAQSGAGAPAFNIIGCAQNSTTLAGDGAVQDVLLAPFCRFQLSTSGGSQGRSGFILAGHFSNASQPLTSCYSGVCPLVSIGFDTQFPLTISGGYRANASLPSETSDGWYLIGDNLSVASEGISQRAGGAGERVVSWSIDGSSPTPVDTEGVVQTNMITMDAPHSVTFSNKSQYEVVLDQAGFAALSGCTNPSIPGDGLWYDSGTLVRCTFNGIFGRAGGHGSRVTSYSWDNGGATPELTSRTFNTTAVSMTGPHSISLGVVTQFSLTLATSGDGTVSTQTQSTIPSDVGWYDAGTSVAFSASPGDGFAFQGWAGAGQGSYSGPGPDVTLQLLGHVAETAIFTSIAPTTTSQSTSSTTTESGGAGSLLGLILAAGIVIVALGAGSFYFIKQRSKKKQ